MASREVAFLAQEIGDVGLGKASLAGQKRDAEGASPNSVE